MDSQRAPSSCGDQQRRQASHRTDPPQQDETIRLERRAVLKLVGISALPVVAGSATAAETGYGTGGYGQGSYGGGTSDVEAPSDPVTVTTTAATDVTAAEATLTGSLSGLSDGTTADCSFEWRAVGTTTWIETASQSVATGTFEETVTDLTAATEYEFRAVAETGAAVYTSEVTTFTTSPLENTLLIDGVGTVGHSQYEAAVSGAIEPTTYQGASIDTDAIDGGRVTGTVSSWRDAFRFSGNLEELAVNGQARVYVNDERVDPANYGGEQSATLTIVGNGTPATYEMTVEGTIEVLEGSDVQVGDTSVEGTIQRGVHRYRITGDLSEFTFHEGETQVYLDSQRLDPADYTGSATLPHLITFDGTETATPSQYRFTTDEAVAPAREGTLDADTTINGTTVRSEVAAGTVDAYRFAGEITDFHLSGRAAVDIEYNIPE